ncbi:MAG: 5'/3'-nucleotidase SurE [Myxococcales bacterium]|nr:5'/3'-nucleotidase SurE [Myxococcales bacterium]
MTESAPPLVVVTNDDGIHSPALHALARALAPLAEVYIVAPETEQSSVSHAITLARPLRLRTLSPRVMTLDGTPADCSYVALHHPGLLPRAPTLVVSGINLGPNLGTDVFYSGTVAGAREATFRGVPGVAFSMPTRADVEQCSTHAATLVARMLGWRAANPAAAPPVLNVNFPEGVPRGVKRCTLGVREYENVVEVRNDPRGRQYLWIGGPKVTHPLQVGSDTEAFEAGYITVTALSLDMNGVDPRPADALLGPLSPAP